MHMRNKLCFLQLNVHILVVVDTTFRFGGGGEMPPPLRLCDFRARVSAAGEAGVAMGEG